MRCAGKFRKNQYTRIVRILRGNILFSNEIHAITQRRQNVAPLQGERHGFAVPVLCMP